MKDFGVVADSVGQGPVILVCGLGSIGARHVSNIRQVWPNASVTVLRRNADTELNSALDGLIDRVVDNIDAAIDPVPLAAIIANPATRHAEIGKLLAQAGVHLMVEKPLAHNIESAESLVQACERKPVKLMVGYNLRFSDQLLKLKSWIEQGRLGRILSVRAEVGQYLPDWRPGKPYTDAVSARSDLGGGVLLELSHELDYLCWMFGQPDSVYGTTGKYSQLEIDVEDTAELLLGYRDPEHQTPFIASVHLDMVQRPPVRNCKIVGDKGCAVWNGIDRQLKIYQNSDSSWSEMEESSDGDRNDMYVKELRHFKDCIENDTQPQVSGADALGVLRIIDAVRRSSGTRSEIKIDN